MIPAPGGAGLRRRLISVGSVLLAVAALVVVLLNATLVDRRPPSVSGIVLSATAGGRPDLAQTLTSIEVQFSEPVRTASVESRFRIEPAVAGVMTWEGSTATFTPSDRLPGDTEFQVSIEPGFEDLAGNVAPGGVDGFVFRTVGPPVVASVEPADGASGAPVDGTVTLAFDRLMDTASVEEAIRIVPVVPVEPAWSGERLTLAFPDPLAFGTTYTITIGTTAADTGGSRLRRPFETSFTTVDTGLQVVATVPAHGVAGINVRTPIAVVFDRPIDPATVGAALTVTPEIGGEVEVVALPSDVAPRDPGAAGDGTVLVLRPSEPLAAHTTYTIRLAPVVARAGMPAEVAPERTWRFTTGGPIASAHNHIAYLSATGGARDLWLMNPDGTAPRQVTSGLAPVTAFDVSGDGTRIAIAAGGVVRLLSVDGSSDSVLTGGSTFEYAPRFSPDGRSLLLARRAADGSDEGWWLVALDAVAGESRQLLSSGAPPLGSTATPGDGIEAGGGLPAWASRSAWSPTGRWILVTTGEGRVVLVDLEAADPASAAVDTGLTGGDAGAWSPTRSRFVIVARDPAATGDGLYAVDPAGTSTRLGDALGSAAVAPDGTVVHLVADPAGVTHVAVTAPGVAGARPLTSDAGLADLWPTFSPDGETVLFGRVLARDGTTSAGIWTIDPSGGPPAALSTDGAYPRWLP